MFPLLHHCLSRHLCSSTCTGLTSSWNRVWLRTCLIYIFLPHTIRGIARHFPHPDSTRCLTSSSRLFTDHCVKVFAFLNLFQSIFIVIRYICFYLALQMHKVISVSFHFIYFDTILVEAAISPRFPVTLAPLSSLCTEILGILHMFSPYPQQHRLLFNSNIFVLGPPSQSISHMLFPCL